MTQTKTEIRKSVLRKRDALTLEERHKNSLVICETVYEFLLQVLTSESETLLRHPEVRNANRRIYEQVEQAKGLNLSRFPLETRSFDSFHSSQDDVNGVAPHKNSSQEFRVSEITTNNKHEFYGLTIALYDAINSEVDLSDLATVLQREGSNVLKPAMLDRKGHMEFVNWDEEFDPLGTFPSLKGTVPADAIDVIVCPLVAFDKAKNRLGYGGGYYDRYLPRLTSDTLKIGVAFSCQEVTHVPAGEFDVPLDLIITEESRSSLTSF